MIYPHISLSLISKWANFHSLDPSSHHYSRILRSLATSTQKHTIISIKGAKMGTLRHVQNSPDNNINKPTQDITSMAAESAIIQLEIFDR